MNTHCFSVDVEGFCESMAESFYIPDEMIRSKREREEIARNVDVVLEFLAYNNVHGTFFILGKIAKEQPEIVRRIAEAGHEIASHSYNHIRLFNQEDRIARESLTASKKILEDISGYEVFGFRAPDFSITRKNIFLLDCLVEAGYKYDSSIFPISGHDVYGMKGARRDIHRLNNGLFEFPPATFTLFKRSFPVLGGGYFRLSPLWLSKFFLNSIERMDSQAMFYTHPYEVGPIYPVFKELSFMRKFRHYVGIDKSKQRFAELFKNFSFGRAIDILKTKGM